jgi:hypothetical protein
MKWPRPGSKVTYKGAEYHWHRDMIERAKDTLVVGETYVLSKVEPLSSWVRVELDGFENMVFSLAFFDYEKPDNERESTEVRRVPPSDQPYDDFWRI